MKRVIACLLVVGAISVLVSGCKKEEEVKVKDVVEEAPAAPAAPKDHPAH